LGIRGTKTFISEGMKNLVDNTGFTFRYSQISYGISFVPLRLFIGCLLYPVYTLRKLYNLLTGRIEFSYLETFITTRCTLRCRDCSVLIPHLSKLEDFNVDDAISDLEKLLSSVDYIHKLGILGGEAMLHKDFCRILDFADSHKKIGSIRVVTNGTFIPNDSVLDSLASSKKLYMNISEYPAVAPAKRSELESVLKGRNIKYISYMDMQWYDLGGPDEPRSDLQTAEKRFRYCWMKRCSGIRDGKLYMCGRSVFLPLVRQVENGESDYLYIRGWDGKENKKSELRRFLRRKSLEACRYCNGTYEGKVVPPAVQL